jgi:hypothetical protein
MKRLFIESPDFESLAASENIAVAEIQELQNDIMLGRGKIIPGTGGIRKVRWGKAGGGKRGGRRVLYADYEDYGLTYLMAFYSKNVKENLNPAETVEWKSFKHILDETVRRNNVKKTQRIL